MKQSDYLKAVEIDKQIQDLNKVITFLEELNPRKNRHIAKVLATADKVQEQLFIEFKNI